MKRYSIFVITTGVLILVFGLLPLARLGVAAPLNQVSTPNPNLSISDETCISCHGQPGQTFPLEDGTELDLYVDPLEHANSIHGSQGYACVQCHVDVGEYPHPPFTASDQRDVTLQLNSVCERCHATQYDLAHDSVHSRALEEGNREAAVCTDCHTAHAVQDWVDEETGETLPEARLLIPQTCAKCHSAIYDVYETSVHGTALTNENNPDVPTCIDCHGVHNIEDPTTAEFRLVSPRLCSDCHSDPLRMTKYGISTDVLDTYVADFHGTTVAIFEKMSPEAETNKPVCYDCHGVHDIKRADDPEKGLHVRENMLATCQKCHPDAQENFPTAWLSHYIPSPDTYPLVYYVNLFYKFLIPTVLGGMLALVMLDASRSFINHRRKSQRIEAPEQALEMDTSEAENTVQTSIQVESENQISRPDQNQEDTSETLMEQAATDANEPIEPLPSNHDEMTLDEGTPEFNTSSDEEPGNG